jgi:hypothetical protein
MARFLWVRNKRVIPVPQLQPLDARDIIKHRIEAEAVKAVVRVEAATAREKAVAAARARATRREKAYTAQRNTWVEAAKAKAERAPLLEVPDMIVFSGDDIDWDGDDPNWWDDPNDWVDFLDWDDDFVPFEVLKKC